MSTVEGIARMLVAATAVVALLGLAVHFRAALRRGTVRDVAVPKGSPATGVVYAFTMGMAPWAKESTRQHWRGYLRGVVFHVGIFVALAMLIASPWYESIPTSIRLALAIIVAGGALAGLGGMFARWSEENLRVISTGDDHLSVLLVTLFLALASAAALRPGILAIWYVVSAILLAYLPFSKIRHLIFFFFGRWYFGRFFGRRGIIELARHPS